MNFKTFFFLQVAWLICSLGIALEVKPKIYLGGPDVFYPNPKEIAESKKKIAAQYGFEGVFPLDNDVPAQETKTKTGLKIFEVNVDLMRQCDLMVANMTSFRGPSMDAGTAYEMGFMMGQGKPVLAYTEDKDSFTDRTIEYLKKMGVSVTYKNGRVKDGNGFGLENFDMKDNLMLHATGVSFPNSAIENSFEAVLKKNQKALLSYFKKAAE